MLYLVARLDLLVTRSRSLKEKRAVVQRLKARLSHRLAASVSEVDHQEVHQRTALGVALIVHRATSARNALALMRAMIDDDPGLTLLEVRSHLGRLEDEGRASWERIDPAEPTAGAVGRPSGAAESEWMREEPDDEYFGEQARGDRA